LKRKYIKNGKWCKQLKCYHETRLKHQINLKNNCLKGLNTRICKVEELNWTKISKRD